MMNSALTPRQQELLQFLLDQRDLEGVCPTHEEIRRHFGFSSANAVQAHLRLMEQKGVIKRNPRKARSIQIVDRPAMRRSAAQILVPLVGWIPAGNPAFALECHEEMLALPRQLFRGRDLFALRVKGDSMTGAGIFDGDVAVLSAATEWADGVIAAVVVDEEATLKRLYRTRQGLRLRAENPAYPDRVITVAAAQNCRIAGILTGTIRRFL